MPIYKIKAPDGNVVNMPWSGADPPESNDIDDFLKNYKAPPPQKDSILKGSVFDSSIPWTQRAKDLLFGKSSVVDKTGVLGEKGKEIPIAGDSSGAESLYSKFARGPIGDIIDNPTRADRGTVRPFVAGAVQGIGDILSGGLDPRAAAIKPVPRINPAAVEQANAATKAARDIVFPPNTPKKPLALPPAPTEARFTAGPAGVAENKNNLYSIGHTDIPAELGAREGIDIGQGRPFVDITKPQKPGLLPPGTQVKVGDSLVRIPEEGTNLPPIENTRRLTTNDISDFSISEEPKPTARKFGTTKQEYKKGLENIEPITDSNSNAPVGDITEAPKPTVAPSPEFVANGDEAAFNETRPKTPNVDPQETAYKSILAKLTGDERGALFLKNNPKPTLEDMEAELQRLDNIRKGKTNTSIPPSTPGPNTVGPTKPIGTATSNNVPYRPIPKEADAKTALKQWADGNNNGAILRGSHMSERFSDLRTGDPDKDLALIDAYESGNRDGRLGDVQKYFDTRWQQAQDLHLLKEDQKRLNYLRHYFEQNPDEVSKAVKTFIAKNPQFAKQGSFPTYAAARGEGLAPKYKTIPDIIGAYETEFNRAVRTKELYDWLKDTGRLSKGTLSDSMPSWKLQGNDADYITRIISNVTGKASPPWLNTSGDISSATKNLYLAGGVPYTKWNMHAYNIARNDAALNGFASAAKKLISDPTGHKAVEWMKNLPDAEKQILEDLADRGWQFHPMSDTGKEVNFPARMAEKVDNKVGKKALEIGGKIMDKVQGATEDPLFARSLPVLNAQRTLEAFHKLEKAGMAREEALKGAVQIGNDFFGAVDTALRSPVSKDAARITFLAPNWLESQLTKAVHQWKSAAKTLTGTDNAVDKIYAKSLGRSAALPSIGAITSAVTAKGILGNGRQRDTAAIPLGNITNPITGKTKTRELPTLTPATEEWRIPVSAPIEMYKGNPAALKDILIKNRISAPASAIIDLVRGEDQFGNPLSGQDKYGRKISTGQAVLNYGKEASRPFQHQMLQALVGWLKGDVSSEEATAQGLELPITYSSPEPEKKRSVSGPRIRTGPRIP